MKKKKRANIVKENDTKIPIVQKIRQNLGAFLEILVIKLFNFLVFNIAIKGKNTKILSFLLRRIKIKARTINQKIIEIMNHGFVIIESAISKELI